MRAARQPRDLRHLRQRQRDHGQDQERQRAAAPAADRQPAEIDAEDRVSSGAMTKLGMAMPTIARAITRVVRPAVLAQRRDDAGEEAQEGGQQHGEPADLEAGGRALDQAAGRR